VDQNTVVVRDMSMTFGGQDIPKNGAVGQYLNNPFRMFTKDNAAEAGVPAQFSKGFGTYQSQYLKLWGLK